jgi:hypothetical protein
MKSNSSPGNDRSEDYSVIPHDRSLVAVRAGVDSENAGVLGIPGRYVPRTHVLERATEGSSAKKDGGWTRNSRSAGRHKNILNAKENRVNLKINALKRVT